MSPAKVKQPDQISLTFVAIVEGMPAHVKLGEHTLEFPESEYLSRTLISGVYGSHSKQVALVMAADWNKQNDNKRSAKSRALLIDVRYRIDNFSESSRPLATRALVDQTGWLHMDRLSAQLRDEIKDEWVAWMEADFDGKQLTRMADKSLAELATEHPRYIERMMAKRSPRLTAIIHPVRPAMAPNETVWAATVRYDKERFVEPVVRFNSVVVDV